MGPSFGQPQPSIAIAFAVRGMERAWLGAQGAAQTRPRVDEGRARPSAKHLFTLVNRSDSRLVLPPLEVAAAA